VADAEIHGEFTSSGTLTANRIDNADRKVVRKLT
jgi:hypothetical protein